MTIEEFTARLERPERANRQLKRAAAAGLLLVVSVAAMGQDSGPSRVIQAERFEVVDGQRGVRATLAISPTGGAALSILDKGAKSRAVLAVDHLVSSRSPGAASLSTRRPSSETPGSTASTCSLMFA
jgi:hypothetical protein